MPSECAAVIKADGYGCGIEPVARALTHAGCRTFFVADISEARRARAAAPSAAAEAIGENARLEIIERAGHWPWLDRPDVIEKTAAFLAG